MAGILDGLLSPLLTTATQAVGGYEQGKANAAKSQLEAAMDRAKIERQAHSSAIDDAYKQAQINDINAQQQQRTYTLQHPKPNYAPPIVGPNGEVSLVNLDDPTHPVKVPGVQGKVEHTPQGPRDQMQLVQSPGPDGKPVYYRVNLTTGEKTPLDLSAVPKGGGGAGSGHGSAQDKRSKSYVDLMVHSYPTIEQFADKVRPAAITTAIKFPTMGNYALTSDEQQYLQAARDFLAGVLHQESGARLTDSQVAFGLQRYVPLAGDSKEVRAQKLAAARQVMQERQADYAGVGGQPTPAPTTAPTGSGGGNPLQTAWDAAAAELRAQGKDTSILGPRP
jgi:hypothetical protein